MITLLRLTNWRNFRDASIPLVARTFVVGPNASGKSNLLDALRFLKELAEDGGGLQRAVSVRGGLKALRSLHARAGTGRPTGAISPRSRPVSCSRH